MFKNRILLVLGVISLLLVTMAVSRPLAITPVASGAGANDFYQRHPDWNRAPAASDYYERHPELNVTVGIAPDATSDFTLRHPQWVSAVQIAVIPVTGNLVASDYFQRHPELRTLTTLDLSDYFLRH